MHDFYTMPGRDGPSSFVLSGSMHDCDTAPEQEWRGLLGAAFVVSFRVIIAHPPGPQQLVANLHFLHSKPFWRMAVEQKWLCLVPCRTVTEHLSRNGAGSVALFACRIRLIFPCDHSSPERPFIATMLSNYKRQPLGTDGSGSFASFTKSLLLFIVPQSGSD